MLFNTPLAEKYPELSPYVYCNNNPIRFVDPDGMELKIYYNDSNGKRTHFRYNGQSNVNHSNAFVNSVIEVYKFNKSNGEREGNGGGASTVMAVEGNKVINVSEAEYYSRYSSGTILWNPNLGSEENGIIVSPATVFDHEADHAVDDKTNPTEHKTNSNTTDAQYENKEERRVITGSEQKTARANGETKKGQVTRTSHGGKAVVTTGVTSTKVDRQQTQEYEKKLQI